MKKKNKKKRVWCNFRIIEWFLGIYFDEYNELPNAKRNKMDPKYDLDNLFLETYNYDDWFKNQESTD